jgi:hypothetical protein
MRNLLRIGLLGAALAFTGWTGLQTQPADAAQFCQTNGRRCFTEGQSFICTYFGCCGYIGTGVCTCSGGYWDCPIPPECPPDFCR